MDGHLLFGKGYRDWQKSAGYPVRTVGEAHELQSGGTRFGYAPAQVCGRME